MPPVPKKKSSRSRTGKRRQGWKFTLPNLSACPSCGKLRLPHQVCPHCGYYAKRGIPPSPK